MDEGEAKWHHESDVDNENGHYNVPYDFEFTMRVDDLNR